jgi:hypothetical protein
LPLLAVNGRFGDKEGQIPGPLLGPRPSSYGILLGARGAFVNPFHYKGRSRVRRPLGILFMTTFFSMFGAAACGGVEEQVQEAQEQVEQEVQGVQEQAEEAVQGERTQIEEEIQEGLKQAEEAVEGQ